MSINYKEIYQEIATGHLLKAISLLREYFSSHRNPNAIDHLNQISSTYRYLLMYLNQGQPDASRNRVISDIKEQLFDILQIASDADSNASDTSLFATERRLVNYAGMNFAETLGRFIGADASIQLSSKDSKDYHEALSVKNLALKDLFTYVWTLPAGCVKQLKEVANVASDNDIAFSLRGVLVGALILSLLRAYDYNKFKTLLSIYSQSSDDRIKARALTGIALTLNHQPERIEADNRLQEQFEALSDDLSFYTHLREVIYSLVKARGGLKFLEKMKTQILPDIQKIGPEIFNRMKNGEGEISIESIEENPEWEKMLRESGMEKKLRRFNNMQANGADMMLSMFEQVKSSHVFNPVDMWFRPYEDWEAERLGIPTELSSLMKLFCSNPGICDTDKYAMMSNLQRVPEAARGMLSSAFEAQAEQISEDVKDMMLHTKSPEFDVECYNFSRNLFRFHTFFRLKKEFFNPFERPLTFYKWPFVGDMLSQREILTSVGEYYFAQGFYSDAADTFRYLLATLREEITDEDSKLKDFYRQKVGSSLERLGRGDDALKFYLDAYSDKNHDEWLAKKIVRLSQKYNVGISKRTFDALLILHLSDKDNTEWLIPLAEYVAAHPEIKKMSSLTNVIERAAYLSPEDSRVVRLLAKKILVEDNNPSEAVKSLASRIDNVEMYLASEALSKDLGDVGNSDKRSSEEEKEMLKDLTLNTFASYIDGNILNMLHSLQLSLSLPVIHPDEKEVIRILNNEFGDTILGDKISTFSQLLPTALDALAVVDNI